MSTTWTRSPIEWLCATCNELRPRGAPRFEIRLKDVTRPLYRCEKCAWESVPDDMPERPIQARERLSLPFVKFPADYKVAQYAEREPGEEG